MFKKKHFIIIIFYFKKMMKNDKKNILHIKVLKMYLKYKKQLKNILNSQINIYFIKHYKIIFKNPFSRIVFENTYQRAKDPI